MSVSKRLFALAALSLIMACGKKGSISKQDVPAYFSGLNQLVQGADANTVIGVGQVFGAICGAGQITTNVSQDQTQADYTLNCDMNGVKATGTIVEKAKTKDNQFTGRTFTGTINFEVVNAEQIAIPACQKTVSKGDTKACAIDVSSTVNAQGQEEYTSKVCGLSWDDFVAAFGANACTK